MNRLSAARFHQAREFIYSAARPLDQALFATYFDGGGAQTVWQALAAYQNEDGGFGNALEPDVRTPSSSALATGNALRLLAETGAPADHALVRSALSYLERTLDPQTQTWRVVPPDTNDHPHAPWWHDADDSLQQTFDGYQIIPRAELLAYILHFSSGRPAWLEPVIASAVAAIETMPLGTGGGDDLVYAIRLAGAAQLAEERRWRLQQRVRAAADDSVTRDPAQWSSYSIPPLKLAPTPDSLVADLFAEDTARNLDYLLETQQAGGYWEPTWNWGDFYPDVWPTARDEWRGELTLHNLLSLRDYGRLA